MTKPPSPGIHDFTVAWISALLIEYIAARQALGEIYGDDTGLLRAKDDHNEYTWGCVGDHLVVLMCLPMESVGLVSASTVFTSMRSTFPYIRFALMVRIAGGSARFDNDIRLGDVVLGAQVVPYGFGKTTPQGFQRTGHISFVRLRSYFVV
ncbi:hypothetical protein ETB97_011931 [Aspergillus alliaceus]|uniref:Nucleoside phosphorylase domain-containing protein n=1 Tax=Petromyces alliaceus TaxID=209559 RepID=A0A8H6A5L2_PETAA|nr:hypothetical protein ETB97_011931 [Aspergillus burnettii]